MQSIGLIRLDSLQLTGWTDLAICKDSNRLRGVLAGEDGRCSVCFVQAGSEVLFVACWAFQVNV